MQDEFAALVGPDQAERLYTHWPFWRRPNQRIKWELDWYVWLILAGRGWGKTRSGAEAVRERVDAGLAGRVGLVGRTPEAAREEMIEGDAESPGLLRLYPKADRPTYYSSRRRLEWPNGAIGHVYSAANPDEIRGPNLHLGWGDEVAAWDNLHLVRNSPWHNLTFCTRLGDPRIILTTTPQPIPLIRHLVDDDPGCITVRGITFENKNLSAAWFERLINQYGGTTLGRQELLAEILDDVEGALWTRSLLDATRRPPVLLSGDDPLKSFKRIVVGVDPAVSATEESSETGIMVAGLNRDNECILLEDRTVTQASPHTWATAAVEAADDYQADRIICEVNNGGDMVESTIRTVDPHASVKQVRASRGKWTRAEPIAALSEQRRLFMGGIFPKLEDQLCSWVPGVRDSPDRLDAMVWAVHELMLRRQLPPPVRPQGETQTPPWRYE